MALPDGGHSRRAYDKGINSKACGWGARAANQWCRDLGQKLQDCDHSKPRGSTGEGKGGSPEGRENCGKQPPRETSQGGTQELMPWSCCFPPSDPLLGSPKPKPGRQS